jgi:uncharacterized protein (TIGR02145 family)
MKVNIKNVIKYVFLVIIAVLGTTATTAQSVQKIGENRTTINSNAALELESTTKGFLPPRMTTAQRNAIASPTMGLVIYNTTTNCLEEFSDAGWYNRCDGSKTAMVSGNASSGGTAVISKFGSYASSYPNIFSVYYCKLGAGTNNSPAGIVQGGVNETMVQGISATGVTTFPFGVNVSTAGTYKITTNTVNGVTFSASGTTTAGSNRMMILTASGTPTLAGNYIWVLNQTTATPSAKYIYGSVLTTNAPLGSSYNAHFNGIIGTAHVGTTYLNASQTTGETFNNNTTCQNQPISAQGCAGVTTVTTSSGRVHNTININGQCWLQTNLIEKPTVYSGYTTTSWTNTTPGDQGYWGYYNTVTSDGSAGFGATEPGTNEGMLYQWCGAMNGAISERSRGICPAGWHIPSDCEWMYLEHGQGMSIAEQNVNNAFRANNTDDQGTPGYKLRSQGTGQTNASSFSGMMAGKRDTNGAFSFRMSDSAWWSSSSIDASSTNLRYLSTGTRGVYRFNYYKSYDISVRCLKD